ncbi:MAG: alanine racemase, partial [Candidatus Omnitrophica bacterium]|nr:alanine racemase [Candidatus Omnitrophota bacterium]
MNTTYRPTWAEINLEAVSNNLKQIRDFLDEGVEIMPVVKANAYGHGICEISRVLVENGIRYLGVATVDEALKLRAAGTDISILVMGSVLEEEARAAVDRDVTLTLCDHGLLQGLVDIAKAIGKRPRVHVKVDTGMGRIGVWHAEALDFIEEVRMNKEIDMEGVYTHFSSAGRDSMYTALQIAYFEDILEKMREKGIRVRYRHAANSIAVVDRKGSHMNLVRPGILLYGIYPKETFRSFLRLKPVMTLKTRIVYLKQTPSGRSISYGRTHITQQETNIATIPIGYADGYGRILSNRAQALVKGQFVRVIGMVTMDQTLLDVGRVRDVKVGDEVVLIGEQGDAALPVEKIARLARTIPYEIVAGITDRVPRIYPPS